MSHQVHHGGAPELGAVRPPRVVCVANNNILTEARHETHTELAQKVTGRYGPGYLGHRYRDRLQHSGREYHPVHGTSVSVAH